MRGNSEKAEKFDDRSFPRSQDAHTRLLHFSILTFKTDPLKLQKLIHPRFQPYVITDRQGREKALVSVVPFLDQDFHLRGLPWLKNSFGQTNYRAYVTDRQSGEQMVWFFGTVLNSLLCAVPRHAWKLPWHREKIEFECDYDQNLKQYRHYGMTCSGPWAPAQVELTDTGKRVGNLEGFDNLETGLQIITHPLQGFYHRRDGRLGSYSVWHPRIEPTSGSLKQARFGLLERLGLWEEDGFHSALVQRTIDFDVCLPPWLME